MQVRPRNGRRGARVVGRPGAGPLRRFAGARACASDTQHAIARRGYSVTGRVAVLQIAVKECGQLRLGQRADLLRVDLAAPCTG